MRPYAISILNRLDATWTTAPHGGFFLCRIDTPGFPPAEGVAENRTDAISMAGYIRRVTALLYIQPWAQA